MLWLLSRGQTARLVAQSTGYSPDWIGQLAKRYNTEGPDGMRNRARLTSQRQVRWITGTAERGGVDLDAPPRGIGGADMRGGGDGQRVASAAAKVEKILEEAAPDPCHPPG
jgi:hypothetical protein